MRRTLTCGLLFAATSLLLLATPGAYAQRERTVEHPQRPLPSIEYRINRNPGTLENFSPEYFAFVHITRPVALRTPQRVYRTSREGLSCCTRLFRVAEERTIVIPVLSFCSAPFVVDVEITAYPEEAECLNCKEDAVWQIYIKEAVAPCWNR